MPDLVGRLVGLLVQRKLGQKIDAGVAALKVLALDLQAVVLPGADAQENGVETLGFQDLPG